MDTDDYIDKGWRRTFRYEARGRLNDTGYSLGCFRTKEEALERALEEQHRNANFSWNGFA